MKKTILNNLTKIVFNKILDKKAIYYITKNRTPQAVYRLNNEYLFVREGYVYPSRYSFEQLQSFENSSEYYSKEIPDF